MPFTEEIEIQLILAVVTIAVAIIGGIFGYLGQRHAKTAATNANHAANEITNNHTTNIREDIDQRFTGLDTGIKEIKRDIGGLREDDRNARRAEQDLRNDVSDLGKRVTTLEKGHPKRVD